MWGGDGGGGGDEGGGGDGIGKAINGGFGLLLDGSERTDEIINSSIPWDTMIGVSRRSWARCDHAIETSMEYNKISKEEGGWEAEQS